MTKEHELDESAHTDMIPGTLKDKAKKLHRQHSRDSKFSFGTSKHLKAPAANHPQIHNSKNVRTGQGKLLNASSHALAHSTRPSPTPKQGGGSKPGPQQSSSTRPLYQGSQSPAPSRPAIPSLPTHKASKVEQSPSIKPPPFGPFNPSSSRDKPTSRTVSEHGHEGCRDLYCEVLREWKQRKRMEATSDAHTLSILRDREERLRQAEIERNRTYSEANPSLSSQRRYQFDPDRIGSDRRAPNPDSKRSDESQDTNRLLAERVPTQKTKTKPNPSASVGLPIHNKPSYKLPSKIDEAAIKVRDELEEEYHKKRRRKKSTGSKASKSSRGSPTGHSKSLKPSKGAERAVKQQAGGSSRAQGPGRTLRTPEKQLPWSQVSPVSRPNPSANSRKPSAEASNLAEQPNIADDSSLDSEERVAERETLYTHLWENLVTIEKLRSSKRQLAGLEQRNAEHNKMAKQVTRSGLEDEFWVEGNQALLDRHRKIARVLTDQANQMPNLAKKVVTKDLMLKLDRFVQTNYKPTLFTASLQSADLHPAH